MPSWNEVLKEISQIQSEANKEISQIQSEASSSLDTIRRKYLNILYKKTKRNVIAYYSAWLQKGNLSGINVNDADKNSLMAAVHKLDRSEGLDLILHTPGGDLAATESLVDYLRTMFGTNIRAIIPQISMSAGTMIACACKEIIMGKPSNLGPIDPQLSGHAAYGVIEEFERAKEEIKADPSTIPLWQVIISKYPATFIGECEKSIDWANGLVKKWLETGMFEGDPDKNKKADIIVKELSDHGKTKSHARHLSLQDCIGFGLRITKMEDMPNDLQDTILTVHHTYMHTFANSNAIKIVENHLGYALINNAVPQK